MRNVIFTLGTAVLSLAAVAQASVYSGNGATGFGGVVGNGSLSVTDDGAGNATFSFTPASSTTLNNYLVLYIDSKPGTGPGLDPTATPGRFSSTATLLDNSGYGEQTAISGAYLNNPNNSNTTTRSTLTFAPGFYASYAVVFKSGYADVFTLPSQTNAGNAGAITYVTGNSTGPTNFTLTIPLADIGVTQGGTFDFVGTYIADSAYRSNETIGTSTTTPDPAGGSGSNAGFNGTQTFSDYKVYATTAVPEPASLGLLGLGALVALRRRK
ncbi:MAG: PEP-CTERM sorting domain-containing protein [Tepidisphaeraceae bacterium]